MKNLAELKRAISQAKQQGILIKTSVFNLNHVAIRYGAYAPIHRVKSNAFSLMRSAESWIEFGKAKQWKFCSDQVVQRLLADGYIEIEFSHPVKLTPEPIKSKPVTNCLAVMS